jgi:hypothetical protein
VPNFPQFHDFFFPPWRPENAGVGSSILPWATTVLFHEVRENACACGRILMRPTCEQPDGAFPPIAESADTSDLARDLRALVSLYLAS